ncbi:uncharacterized protein LOC144991926 isoform X2 [Oryzias latipes]
MNFSCFKAFDPNITRADGLFLHSNNNHNLWNGTAPLCSSVSPPAPSKCLVCFQDSLYAVCSYFLEETPVMEGDGNNIQIAESEGCPTFQDDQRWWIILLIVFVLLFIFSLCVVIWKREKICILFQRLREKIWAKPEEDAAGNSDSPHGPFMCLTE